MFQYGSKEVREAWSELQLAVDKVFKKENIQPELLHGDFCPVNFGQAGNETGTATIVAVRCWITLGSLTRARLFKTNDVVS